MKSSGQDTIKCLREKSEKKFKLRGEECNFRREERQLNKQQEHLLLVQPGAVI